MKKYELLYIVHPDLENTLDKVTDKVKNLITRRKGVILNEENWGKKKLAYKIQKSDLGIYVLVDFEVEPTSVNQIERDIRLSEEVIRHMVVSKEEVLTIEEAPRVKKVKTETKEEIKELKEVKEEKPKKTKKEEEKDEAERLKKLDEKLDEIVGGTE